MRWPPPIKSPEQRRKELIEEATDHIAKARAMKALIETQPDFAITVKVAGLKFGLCNDEAFLKMMDAEIAEAKKCIKGEPNKYE